MSGLWTDDDDDRLRAQLERGNGKVSWADLAKTAFPTAKFSKAECMERWKSLSKPKPLRGPWTKEEDAKLEQLVERYGSEKWVMIANEMGSRSGKQCRERWHNHLDPSINKGEWTAEEDALIHRLYAKMGSRWAEMAKHLPGRPDNAIKNYWNASLIREKRRRGGSIGGNGSISSMSAFDPSAGDASPSMSRSTSTNSLSSSQRFTPYVRSSPMTKTRSDSLSNPSLSGLTSPVRRASAAADPFSPSMNPFKSPGMSRSQSYQNYSPSTRQLSMSSQVPLHIVSRDLSKDMIDPGAGRFDNGTDTPPATPSRSPLPQHPKSSPPLSGAYGHSPPSPPSSSASSIFYQQPHPDHGFEISTPTSEWGEPFSGGFSDLSGFNSPFQQLHISDSHFEAFEPFNPHSMQEPSSPFLENAYAHPGPAPLRQSLGHGHSYSYDATTARQYQPQHTSHLPHSASHEARLTHHQHHGSFDLSASVSSPFIHPHHQFVPEPIYEFLQGPGLEPSSTAVDDWSVLSPPPIFPDPQPHTVLSSTQAPSPINPYSSPGYSGPSYEEIEAAAERDRLSHSLSDSSLAGFDAQRGGHRHGSQGSSTSLGSAESSHSSPYLGGYSSPIAQSPSPFEQQQQQPHSQAHRELSVSVGAIFSHADVKRAEALHASMGAGSSRPGSSAGLLSSRLSGLAAPINLGSSGYEVGSAPPLHRTMSTPTGNQRIKMERALSASASSTPDNHSGGGGGDSSFSSTTPTPTRYRGLDSMKLKLETASLAGNGSPRSASTFGGSAAPWMAMSASSPRSKHHPTSDLMEVDRHGRACLPGMGAR